MKKFYTNSFFVLFVLLALASNVFAQAPPSNLEGEALRAWLKENYYDGKHDQLGYTTARMYMYNYIDNHNNTITGVYSGYEVSWTYGGTGTNPAPINCEHTVPQSYFGSSEPMKSDIHHLFPTYSSWNSTRSNHPFAEINDSQTTKWMYLTSSQSSVPTYNIDLYSEYASSQFEPREDHKGNLARAVFYFYTMYPTQAGSITSVCDLETLYAWHLADPVDAAEIQRNNAIETYQGDRNPYIDYPDAVATAWGFEAAGPTVPSAPAISLSASETEIQLTWNDVSNETGYYLYKSTNGFSFSLLGTLSANTTSYDDASVSEETTYYYYIVAYNAEGNSSNSNTISGQLSSGSTGGTGNGTISNLIISEYIEGSSYNKVIEIANFTGASVNLSNYSLKKQTNGAGDWGSELTLSGTLAHGEVYVIANSNASSNFTAEADLTTTSGSLSFNGNDPVGLFEGSTLVDAVGTFGSTANFGKDVTLVRNADVTEPNATYTTSEWTSYSTDTYEYLGTHSVDGGGSSIDTESPSKVLGLASSTITETSFSVSWTAATDNVAVTSYVVYLDGVSQGTTSATSFDFSGLTASTTYSVQVIAADAAGNESPISSALSVTTDTPVSSGTEIVLEIKLDNYPSETSWEVLDNNNAVVASGGNYSTKNATETEILDLENGCYTLVINDSYGDGIINGSYQVTVDGTVVTSGSGNDFTSTVSKSFCTNGSTPAEPTELVLNLRITFDRYASESSWEITDTNSAVVASNSYSSSKNSTTVTENITLPEGCYTLKMKDSYGDGMCCTYGEGSYELTIGTTTLASGGEFTSSDATDFCIDESKKSALAEVTENKATVTNMTLYPNPTIDFCTIKIAEIKDENLQVIVTNLYGQIVKVDNWDANDPEFDIEMSEMPTGTYLVTVKGTDTNFSQKVIKK